MARYLKRGMDSGAIKAADAKVRETVETILSAIEERRDAAVRELSQKFDNWSPQDFRLSAPEIERAIANAIFDATGVRIRQVPFTPQRIKTALAAMRR